MAEIIACPDCQRQLQIPENYFGQLVQCPDCQHQFQAVPASSAVQSSAPPPPKIESPAPAEKRAGAEGGDLDRLSRRRRGLELDDEDRHDDRDDDVDIRRGHVYQQQHRGAIVLMLGILSICCIGAPITGLVAWILGHMDLKEMDAGRMDPSGRGQTQTGKVLGMISVFLMVLVIGAYCVIGFFFAGMGAIQGGPRRRRF